MDQRLHAARRSVHLATRQAYIALISSNETIVMDPANDPAIIHTNAEEEGEDDDTIDNDASNNNSNTRAGMDLGLSLFGTSQSYRDQLEEEFDEQLGKVERELEDIRSGLDMLLDEDEEGSVAMNDRARSTMPGLHNAVSNDDDTYSDYGETMTEMLMDDNNTHFSESSSPTTNDVAKLQTHIAFLQQCAKSRKLLDNVDTLSLTTNFATATNSTNSRSTPQYNGVVFPYSPSSICSPSEFMRFTFDSVTAGGGEEGAAVSGTTASPMVQAAQLVQQAEEILNEVMDTLKQECADEAANINSGDQENNGVTQMHAQMLNELQHQTRRKKMELRHRATTLVDVCIAVEENRLLVRGDSSGSDTGSSGIGMGASPISASTPTNNNATPPSPLSDAYQVLQLFSNDNFPTFGETLDGTMKSLAQKLLRVIQPCLNELESKRKEQRKQQQVGYYTFTQETLRSARSMGRDRKFDPVSIKGPAVQLLWTLNSATLDNHAGSDSAENGETSTLPIATAANLDEQTLSSSPLPSTATFLASLNFLSNFFSFVHTEVLLRRMDLASMLGSHLFGTFPLSSQSTSIAAGSAFLSGSVLVGSAAQGVEEGEIRPLMTEMVRSMKKWCVPKKSAGEEVGGKLRRMEVCLIREVGAFEEKMAEIGLMNGAVSSDGGGRADVGTTGAAASSPTGLSLLLDNNGSVMDSPTHPTSATLSNLSSLDTTLTFPPKKVTQTTILSPLSQLAHSLRQAYVESQRSHILNLGRSILLTTDYHNTLREGTFVSDLAGCDDGTDNNGATPLASLDKDRLSELFAFHECSISTTAKQILDLCRETLDDATDYMNDNNHEQDHGVDQLDSLPPMLYRTSRELLDLFRAIVPTLHASEVGSIPRTAAVLHNDCVFLAHEALLLGAEYKSKFQSLESSSEGDDSKTKLLGEVCTFVDMVPPFRDLATKSMGSMIELQKGQLYELVSPRLSNFQQALASNESVTEWDDAETALRAALYHLRHLSQAWSKVLSRNVYHMSMGNLVDLVLTLFLDPVLKAEDITEVASRFVHSLFLDLGRGGADLFLVDDGGDDAPSNNNQEMLSTENTMLQRRFQVAKIYSTLFSKSQAVGQFMTMRLGEIERGLEEGVFRSVTARELMHLIGAAFGEGEKRTVLLNALASR